MNSTNRWIKGAALIAAAVILTSCMPKVVPEGYALLGKREVNFGLDRDTIRVDRAAGPISQLMIVATFNPVEVHTIRVFFENGATFDANVRERLFVGRDRLLIDLPGGARKISEVTFRYRKVNDAVRRAVVELWGK
ncbi:MAG: hypothetical protein PHI34_02545 [Acidobacteriota bacterium]|nr:hypothetical protein [Acidobacteriota bacterium]